MTRDSGVTAAMRALSAVFDELGVPAMIIGGMAVIARGVPRHTVDIDATLTAEGVDIDRVCAVLAAHDIVPRVPDAAAFARERQVLLVKHIGSETPLDISLAWLPFERDALGRSTVVDFAGVPLRVACTEDLLVYKFVAWRERDRSDIERLVARHRGRLDLDAARVIIVQFADLLEVPERVAEFDAIVRRALE